MLEHAEISILEAERLAETTALAKVHKDSEYLKGIIGLVQEVWPPELLPNDLRRLAENIRTVIKLAGIDLARLRQLIEAERQRQKGMLPVNISPYAFVVQSVLWHDGDKIRSALAAANRREKILLTEEMELPPWAVSATLRNAVWITGQPSGKA
jgi:hypothetical protein